MHTRIHALLVYRSFCNVCEKASVVFISAFLKSKQVFTIARNKFKLCSFLLITGRNVKGNLPKKKANKEWKKESTDSLQTAAKHCPWDEG